MAVRRYFKLAPGGRVVHAAHVMLGLDRTLCGREIAASADKLEAAIRSPIFIEARWRSTREAYRRTTCKSCRRSFAESIRGK